MIAATAALSEQLFKLLRFAHRSILGPGTNHRAQQISRRADILQMFIRKVSAPAKLATDFGSPLESGKLSGVHRRCVLGERVLRVRHGRHYLRVRAHREPHYP